MQEIKIYIVKIVILTILIQLIGALIKKASFKKIYDLVGGVIVIFALLGISLENINFEIPIIQQDESYNTNQNIVEAQFAQNVSTKIQEDIKDSYGFEGDVEIYSDLNSIKITVRGDMGEYGEDMYKYIRDKYCTDNDEVELINEVY